MPAGFDFALSPPAHDDFARLRERIASACRGDEAQAVAALIGEARLAPDELAKAQALASKLAEAVRVERSNAGGVDALMLEFSLDSREGIALMCLAEALLRIPDAATRDRLIRDKISKGDWRRTSARRRRCSSTPRRGVCSSPAARRFAQRGHARAGARVAAAQGRRAADPQGRGSRDAPARPAVRHRPHDRRGARQRARARGARLHVFVRHAGRGGDDRRRRRALLRRLRARDPRDRPRGRRCAASSRVPASRSSCRRCIRAIRARSASACMAELVPRVARARAARARLRHRLQHRRRGSRPARSFARHPRGARRRSGARRLAGPRLRRAGLPEARAARDRLDRRARAPRIAGG